MFVDDLADEEPDEFPSMQQLAQIPPSPAQDGYLRFPSSTVTIGEEGVDFQNGESFRIAKRDLQVTRLLGQGRYGIVMEVNYKKTNHLMAMKQIRLNVTEEGLRQILAELNVLYKSQSMYIVDFYGAFFKDSCVYFCMELMDCGSLDKLHRGGVPENILIPITISVIRGLKYLKEHLDVIHRDVRPSNILVNSKGYVKLCDFGISKQLNASMAQTCIGCQKYMAPERITASENQPYGVASDIWSLGLTLIELGTDQFPFPHFENIFAQLQVIVEGEPPSLTSTDPNRKFSKECHEFVSHCLQKKPEHRPTLNEMLNHPWLREFSEIDFTSEIAAWVAQSMTQRESNPANLSIPDISLLM